MALTSYAQNFEDLMLWRALGHVEDGFYLDIGAQDPSFDSVSRCFYENGWRGMHVEPATAYATLLREQRSDETVVEAIVGADQGMATFFEIRSTGLSTGRSDIASRHSSSGFEVQERLVPRVTLASLLDVIGDRPVHWLKIDVEGMEREVLEGWGEHIARPWVLVIESTYPGTREPTEDEWLELVLQRGYREVWFDGLSRFFLAQGHDDLLAAFELPPNIFDGFAITIDHLMATPMRHQSAALEEQHEADLARLRSEVDAAQSREEQLQAKFSEEERATRASFREILTDLSSRERVVREGFENTQKDLLARAELLEQQLMAERETKEVERQEHLVREKELRGLVETTRQAQRDQFEAFQAQARQFADQRQESQRLLVEAGNREAAGLTEIALLKAQLDEAGKKLDAALNEAHQLRDRHEAESLKMGEWLHAERARGARVQGELDGVRQAVSGFLHRVAMPLSELQTRLFGAQTGLEAVHLLDLREGSDQAPHDEVGSVADLLKAHDADFVRLSYLTLLGREPDPAGQEHYLGKLRSGRSKAKIIGDIARSTEADRYGSTLQGLDRLTHQGIFKRLLTRGDHETIEQREVNRFENALGKELQALADLIK